MKVLVNVSNLGQLSQHSLDSYQVKIIWRFVCLSPSIAEVYSDGFNLVQFSSAYLSPFLSLHLVPPLGSHGDYAIPRQMKIAQGHLAFEIIKKC